jgi:histidinol-phosphatase (PHP family)
MPANIGLATLSWGCGRDVDPAEIHSRSMWLHNTPNNTHHNKPREAGQKETAAVESERQPARVSVHGGHCAQFCSHAVDSLDRVVDAYVEQGFAWAGITEHMPGARDAMVNPEERSAGLSATGTQDRFAAYIETCRELQTQRRAEIELFVAFEAEAYSDYEPFLEDLLTKFRPDYIVGSVHHVGDVPFDQSKERYADAIDVAGGIDALYCDYFDLQYRLICDFEPAVVGHFDLIRLFDPEYTKRLTPASTRIWDRIERNLHAVRERDLILDFNVRALSKGQPEPYVSAPILARACALGVAIAPGDDSHGAVSVGLNIDRGGRMLADLGFTTQWPRPA